MKNKIGKFAAAVAAALCALIMFAGCNPQEMSSLRALTKPYCCAYECERAILDGKDILSNFRLVTLELQDGGSFTVTAVPQKGRELKGEGTYSYDEEKDELTLSAEYAGKTYTKTVPVENGSFTISKSFGGRELILTFSVRG